MADEIMTSRQAAEKWDVTPRRVNAYIRDNRIKGAYKVGSVWVMPAETQKPADERLGSGKFIGAKAKRRERLEQQTPRQTEFDSDTPDKMVRAFQKLFSRKEAIFQFLDYFPYMIEIFAPDGTSVYVNKKAMEETNVPDPQFVIGKYNVLKDPVGNYVPGQKEWMERAFKGETISVSDIRIPYEALTEQYEQKDENFSQIKFQNIHAFPIYDEQQKIMFTAMIFITTQTYTGRLDIIRAQEYMNQHWMEEFNRNKIADAIHISRSHFSGLFKQHTEITPHEYYRNIKIRKIKEKLCDPNLTVTQAFTACGVDYKGKYAQYFKEIVGITPSEYREAKFRTK